MMKLSLILTILVACGSSNTSPPAPNTSPPAPTPSGVVVKRDGSAFLLGDGKFSMTAPQQPLIGVTKVQQGTITTISMTEPTKRYSITLTLIDSEYSSQKDIETLENSFLEGGNISDVLWAPDCGGFKDFPCRYSNGLWHDDAGHPETTTTWAVHVAKQKRVYIFTVIEVDKFHPLAHGEIRDLFNRLMIL